MLSYLFSSMRNNNKLVSTIHWFLFAICFALLCNCNRVWADPDYLPIPPFTDPIWHPGGSILGFNHTPISGSPAAGFAYKLDSAGFWLADSNGTSMRRALTFQLKDPAWSPDGRWIAFANQRVIWKMPFDGVNFDTTQIYKLTDGKADCINPAWNTTGDTIYFDSDYNYDMVKPYRIYKMASDGSGQTLIGNKGIDSISSSHASCTADGQILHIRGDTKSYYVFSMDTNGDNVKQLSDYTGSPKVLDNPLKYGVNIFYEDYGIWVTNGISPVKKIVDASTQGFSISKKGIIAFVNFSNSSGAFIDHSHACIWTANHDGTNQHVFLMNNY